MPNRRMPGFNKNKDGRFRTKYRGKIKWFGRDPVKAKLAYDDWLTNVWAPDQALRSEVRSQRNKTIVLPWKVPTELAWLAESLREYISWKYPPSVYFLLRDEFLEYIGSTVDLPNRVRQHLQEGKKFDRVLWMPVERERLRSVESRLIQMLKPGGNQRGKRDSPRVEEKRPSGAEADLLRMIHQAASADE